jgi:hypothetical protein
MNSSLHLTCDAIARGCLVLADELPRTVNQTQFEYALELVSVAFKSPRSPYLHWWDAQCTGGNQGNARQVARRLDLELGRKGLIRNNRKGGYCLAVDPPKILLTDTVWQLPTQLVAASVLDDLKRAVDKFWEQFYRAM